jgi:hypothetical protein
MSDPHRPHRPLREDTFEDRTEEYERRLEHLEPDVLNDLLQAYETPPVRKGTNASGSEKKAKKKEDTKDGVEEPVNTKSKERKEKEKAKKDTRTSKQSTIQRPKRYTCGICRVEFATADELDAHMKTHRGEAYQGPRVCEDPLDRQRWGFFRK